MATRLYLPASAVATAITPSPSASWEDSTGFTRAYMATTKLGDAMATLNFDNANSGQQEVMIRQFISHPLTPGQTITGNQDVEYQARHSETDDLNNLQICAGIRIIAGDGSTVRMTLIDVIVEASGEFTTSLVNRRWSKTGAVSNYSPTVSGDRIVFEIGASGNPSSTATHGFSVRLGDAAASDLPEDNTTTNDFNPWFELADTLTFDAEPSAGTILVHPGMAGQMKEMTGRINA